MPSKDFISSLLVRSMFRLFSNFFILGFYRNLLEEFHLVFSNVLVFRVIGNIVLFFFVSFSGGKFVTGDLVSTIKSSLFCYFLFSWECCFFGQLRVFICLWTCRCHFPGSARVPCFLFPLVAFVVQICKLSQNTLSCLNYGMSTVGLGICGWGSKLVRCNKCNFALLVFFFNPFRILLYVFLCRASSFSEFHISAII